MPDTKVISILDAEQIDYRVLPHREPVFTVEAAARQRGVVKEEMVKSILLRDKAGRYVMACVTGVARLDTRAVRSQLPPGWGRLQFASAEEILSVTGFTQGAVAPVGLSEEIPVLFDVSIARCRKVNISSGDPMAGLELDTEALIRVSGASLAPIAQEN